MYKRILIVVFVGIFSLIVSAQARFVEDISDSADIEKDCLVKMIFRDSGVISAQMSQFSVPGHKIKEVRIYSDDGKGYFESIAIIDPGYSDISSRVQSQLLNFSTREYHGRRFTEFQDRVSLNSMVRQHLKKGENIEIEFYLK
ncbi:MAG: hypothetical protein WC863_00365 [Patescibacteria group bacterium]